MFIGDMNKKREQAMAKVRNAIALHNGQTLLSTGITGDDARLAKAVCDAGVKMLEPNHRGHRGVNNMHAAEQIRHEISTAQMAEAVNGIRNVIPDDVFITVGIAGGFTETIPVPVTEEDILQIARAGADGLHTHKSTFEDLADIVSLAHRFGLTVDAYIGHPDDLHTFGIPAETPEEVAEVAKKMEAIGVDMIGLMTGMSYEGVAAGEIPEQIKARLKALVGAVSVPTLAEGGINVANAKAFKETGVNILVVGTAIDNVVCQAAAQVTQSFIHHN